jgi:hypothetical protein
MTPFGPESIILLNHTASFGPENIILPNQTAPFGPENASLPKKTMTFGHTSRIPSKRKALKHSFLHFCAPDVRK